MMKKLLKKSYLFLFLITAANSFAQFTVSFDEVPTQIEEDGTLSPSEALVITVDNIPNGNVNAEIVVQVRMMPNGSSIIGGTDRITQMDLDTNSATADGVVDANHSIVTTTGTNSGTFKRTFTVTNLVPRDGQSFPIGTDVCYAAVRVKDFVGSPSNNEFRHEATSGNGWSGTIDGVANNTLSTSNLSSISESIFPNPVSSVLNISKNINTKTYKVINLLGKIVKQTDATGNIDVSDLPAGIYVLHTDVGNAKFVKK